MEKENIKIVENPNNIMIYKKDNGGSWYKIVDIKEDRGVEEYYQFLAIVEYDKITPIRKTRRTKFYYIDKRYF